MPAARSRQPPPLPPAERTLVGAELTGERLLQAAHELLFERSGGAVSVSDICTRAGANVAMVKYCFGSKDQLIDALIDRVMHELTRSLDRLAARDMTPTDTMRLHVAGIVRNYVRYPYINRLMNERLLAAETPSVDGMARAFALPARDFHATVLERGRLEEGWPEIDPTLFFFSVVGLCEFVFAGRAWLERAFEQPLDDPFVERFIEHTTDTVLRSLLP